MARIAFDLDGTLIDSAPDLHALANRVLAARGVAPVTLAETHGFIGQGVDVFVRRLRASRGIPEDAHGDIRDAFMAGYEEAVELTTIIEGADEAVRRLRRDGHSIGICTNKPLGPAQAVLRHLGLMPLIDAIVGGDSTPSRKPDPAPLIATFEALGEGPAIYVGDSEIDAEAARRAEIPFVLFTEGYLNADPEGLPAAARFSEFRDLPGIVRHLTGEAG